MNNSHSRHTGAHLDAILDGRPTRDPLGNLVAVLRAPAQPHELTGLDAALSVFAAGPSGAPTPEVPAPMPKTLAGRALTVKLLALIAGAAATGGAAYAATASTSSAPHQRSVVADEASGAPSSDAPGSTGPSGSDSSLPGSSTSAGTAPTSGSASNRATESAATQHAAAAPSPSLVGLCTAWLAHPRDVAKVSTNPAFSVLIKAAGGTDAVNGYCTTLLATAHPAHPSQAENSSHPTHPSQAQNSSHPTHPSQAQNSSHPTHPTQAHNRSNPHPHP